MMNTITIEKQQNELEIKTDCYSNKRAAQIQALLIKCSSNLLEKAAFLWAEPNTTQKAFKK